MGLDVQDVHHPQVISNVHIHARHVVGNMI